MKATMIQTNNAGVVTREVVNGTVDFMRHQIGRMETRVESFPIYREGKQVGMKQSEKKTGTVFRLLGFGKTLEAATAMAKPYLT